MNLKVGSVFGDLVVRWPDGSELAKFHSPTVIAAMDKVKCMLDTTYCVESKPRKLGAPVLKVDWHHSIGHHFCLVTAIKVFCLPTEDVLSSLNRTGDEEVNDIVVGKGSDVIYGLTIGFRNKTNDKLLLSVPIKVLKTARKLRKSSVGCEWTLTTPGWGWKLEIKFATKVSMWLVRDVHAGERHYHPIEDLSWWNNL